MENVITCSASSRLVGEQLFATVKQTVIWFILEYTFPMGLNAFAESTIPREVKNHLNSYLEIIPNSRLLLIKRDASVISEELRLYVVNARQVDPFFNGISFSEYEELLQHDLLDYAKQKMENHTQSQEAPFFLVCTNGRRDQCCAKLGLSVYQILSNSIEHTVWQSSHVGGHRFAPNIICFPHGIYYGRVDPKDALRVLENYRNGKLNLEYYRGRACFSYPAQAGEFYLRNNTSILDIEAYELTEEIESSPDQCTLRYISRPDGDIHTLRISVELSDFEVYTGCQKTKGSKQNLYRLTDHQII